MFHAYARATYLASRFSPPRDVRLHGFRAHVENRIIQTPRVTVVGKSATIIFRTPRAVGNGIIFICRPRLAQRTLLYFNNTTLYRVAHVCAACPSVCVCAPCGHCCANHPAVVSNSSSPGGGVYLLGFFFTPLSKHGDSNSPIVFARSDFCDSLRGRQ